MVNTNEIVVKVENLKKIFQTGDTYFTVLKSLNLSVKKGEIVTIVGRSGSGKSTLLNLIGGLDKPTEGSIIINGTRIENSDETGSYFVVDPDAGTELTVEQMDILDRLGHIIDEELSERQRQALVGVAIQGMPLEEIARRMNTNRNALYKLLHDARMKLKKRFAKDGLQVSDIFATFER